MESDGSNPSLEPPLASTLTDTNARKGLKLSEVERRTQAKQMMARALLGATRLELAKEFNLDRHTVSRRLEQAYDQGLVHAEVKRFVAREFLPHSLAVLEDALNSSNEKIATSAAFKVIDWLGIFKSTPDGNTSATDGGDGVESLEVFRARITRLGPAPAAGPTWQSPDAINPEFTSSAPEGDDAVGPSAAAPVGLLSVAGPAPAEEAAPHAPEAGTPDGEGRVPGGVQRSEGDVITPEVEQ